MQPHPWHMGKISNTLLAAMLFASGCQHVAQRPAAVTPQNLRAPSNDFVFEATPAEISPGEESLLEWRIRGATKVVIEEAAYGDKLHTLGIFDAAGSVRVRPMESSTYVISCGEGASVSCASVTVKVKYKND